MSYESALKKLDEVIVGGGGAANIPFNSIDQRFRSLKAIVDCRIDTTIQVLRIQFNGDTGANYDYDWVAANAGSVSNVEGVASTSIRLGSAAGTDFPTNVSTSLEMTMPNYAGTTFQKTLWFWEAVKAANSTTNVQAWTGAGYWRSTAAITSILLFPASGNFVSGSTASLYGIV